MTKSSVSVARMLHVDRLTPPPFGHRGVQDAPMQSFVFKLSSQRMYRDLFWCLAAIAPLFILVFVALLAVPRYRRVAAVGLLVCAAGAVLVAVAFHYTYALGIWAGHDSAIRYLDESALRAGFSASAVYYGLGLSVCAAWWRWVKPALPPSSSRKLRR